MKLSISISSIFNFDNEHFDSGYLGGFYKSEAWGSWSRLERPWLFLNRSLSGEFSVEFTARGFGATVGQEMSVTIGGVSRNFTLYREPSVHYLHFSGVAKSNYIYFSGIDVTPQLDSPDNRSMALGLQSLEVTEQVVEWSGEPLSFSFNIESVDKNNLIGFYTPEAWGAWSKLENPWVFLNRYLCDDFSVEFTARGFGSTIGKRMRVTIGGVFQDFTLCREPSVHHLQFSGVTKSNGIYFSGIDFTPQPGCLDTRSIALGLQSLKITDSSIDRRCDAIPVCLPVYEPVKVEIEGVVYCSVFNPVDARKNWEDIVSSFCFAFRDEENVTLLLKITHSELGSFMGRLNFLLQKIGEVKCRVIAVHGFLSSDSYQHLIDVTDFYVNSSSAEGLCLPMMEFMASGVPAITPDHTAMADYIDSDSSFVLTSSRSPTIWPHDTRQLKRATNYRVCWESLVDNYKASYQCATLNSEHYQSKSNCSKAVINKLSSDVEVKSRVSSFLSLAAG